MRTMLKMSLLCVVLLLLVTIDAFAHFAMIIPDTDVVGKDQSKDLGIVIQFAHPFEGGPQMQMDKPRKFGVVSGSSVQDLLGSLQEKNVDGKSTWTTTFKIKRPADYVFFLVPAPYWEAAEDKFIVHVTKVIVDALAAQEGWDQSIAGKAGLPAEIVPLTRPYSLYAGNVFTGQVLRDGKPASHVDVEVEWWGKGKTKAPTETHVTQVVKTDERGIFTYAMPKPGWWGFAALMESPQKIRRNGEDKSVELGAVIWVHAYPMQ